MVIPELERPGGLSFPLRLRGSGSLALLFHASIRLIMWSFIAIVCLGCQGMMTAQPAQPPLQLHASPLALAKASRPSRQASHAISSAPMASRLPMPVSS